jgi:hypothetical protein
MADEQRRHNDGRGILRRIMMSDQLGLSKVSLGKGKEITVDLRLVTLKEFRSIFEKNQPQIDEDTIVAKACGLTVDQYLDLPQPTARRIIDAFMKAATQPLADPNSASASTSD